VVEFGWDYKDNHNNFKGEIWFVMIIYFYLNDHTYFLYTLDQSLKTPWGLSFDKVLCTQNNITIFFRVLGGLPLEILILVLFLMLLLLYFYYQSNSITHYHYVC
jgi:hypothetical protein